MWMWDLTVGEHRQEISRLLFKFSLFSLSSNGRTTHHQRHHLFLPKSSTESTSMSSSETSETSVKKEKLKQSSSKKKERKSPEVADSDSDEKSDRKRQKVDKKSTESSSSKKPKSKKAATPESEDGDFKLELGNNRFVIVREFRGKSMVDIREFYMHESGEMRPGKKGIALTPAQWTKLVGSAKEVEKALDDL